jgi:hypothetical protein
MACGARPRRTSTLAWEAAVRSFGIAPTPRPRPNPLLWLSYALWRPLPDRYRLWVLYDTTCSTWVLRYVLRIVVLATPLCVAVAVFLPAPAEISMSTAIVCGTLSVLFTSVWVNEGTEYRLVQAGWRWDTGPELRARRVAMADRISHGQHYPGAS